MLESIDLIKSYSFDYKFDELQENEIIKLQMDYSLILKDYIEYLRTQHWSVGKNKTHAVYFDLKSKYPNMPTGYLQTSRDIACELIKVRETNKRKIKKKAKKSRKWKKRKFPKIPTPKEISTIRMDKRTCTLNKKKSELTFSCYGKRKKIQLSIPSFFQEIYQTWNFQGCQLEYDAKRKIHRFHLIFKKSVAVDKESQIESLIGIDLGLYNPITIFNTKDKSVEHFKSLTKRVKAIRRKYNYLRRQLQTKVGKKKDEGVRAKGLKRKLKKLSGREKRFSTNINHIISKEIANIDVDIIVFEDLTDIRDITGKAYFDLKSYIKENPNATSEELYKLIQKDRKKRFFNRCMSQWSFNQLQFFVEYKAKERGKEVYYVNPYHTSKECSKCHEIGKRNKSKFDCPICGNKDHSDVNDSKNIMLRYALENMDRFNEALDNYIKKKTSSSVKEAGCLVNHPNVSKEKKRRSYDIDSSQFNSGTSPQPCAMGS